MPVEESQVFQDLMRLKPDDLTPNAWAVRSGVSRTVWADMRRHGNPSRRTLAKLLAAAGSSLAEFEALRIGDAPQPQSEPAFAGLGDVRTGKWPGPPLQPLPLIAAGFGGEWEDADRRIEMIEICSARILDRLPRPPSLAGDREAYAITIVGDSMWPRFRPGRRIAVSPSAAAAIGDDVLVQLNGGGDEQPSDRVRAMVKELVRRTSDQVELRQFNPDTVFGVPGPRIAAIHKVMGELL